MLYCDLSNSFYFNLQIRIFKYKNKLELTMKNKFVLLLFVLILITACNKYSSETANGGQAELDKNGENIVATANSPSGEKITVETNLGDNAGNWCPEGGQWAVTKDAGVNSGVSNCNIKNLETEGKWAGFCHIICDVSMPNVGSIQYNYWWDKEQKSGLFQYTMNGQTFSKEIHK